jgi:sugar phosphate isomerase/epimerase
MRRIYIRNAQDTVWKCTPGYNPRMRTNRRAFMTALAASLAAPAIPRARRDRRYPIAFSTLGCPEWSWKTILDQADRLGYMAIELRGVMGEMDLPKVPELSGSHLAATKKDLSALGLVISDLGASATMHQTGAAREKALDEGRRFIDLAHAMDVKYVRMFGDQIAAGEPRETVFSRVIEGFQQMAAHAKPAGVTVLIESHGDFTHSKDIEAVRSGVMSDAFAVLWDAHHTYIDGHEPPADTYAALGRWVRHTHLKDSMPAGADRRYVLTGTGDVPVKSQVRVLAAAGYKGYYCFEWEKKWHPEIEEPEVAFPHFARAMTHYLKDAGVKPV